VSTIIIGVDDSERSEDAIAFGRRVAAASSAHTVVTNAYPYSDTPSRASNASYRNALREDAVETASGLRGKLEGVAPERSLIRVAADPSPARALHRIAQAERAALLIVGSTHTGRVGRVLPGSTGERLLHGAPCAVAVVPNGYREHADATTGVIGVAYDESDEAKAALSAAVALAKALGASLELIGVVSTEYLSTPALMGGPDVATLREEAEQAVQTSLDAAVAQVPPDVKAGVYRMTGDPVELLAHRSTQLDMLVMGSRGYGPLHAVLVGGVSGRLMRRAECPLIVVPRGIEAPLESLFDASAQAVA
jgi:nucleotide-binding universal stress UspA family protein